MEKYLKNPDLYIKKQIIKLNKNKKITEANYLHVLCYFLKAKK